MPPTLADRLIHILTAVDMVQTLLTNKTLEDVAADLPLRLAIERAFEIMCEASQQIPDDIKAGEPAIDWRRMIDFGNLLRHAYHRVDPQIMLKIAAEELPRLKAFAERVIQESQK